MINAYVGKLEVYVKTNIIKVVSIFIRLHNFSNKPRVLANALQKDKIIFYDQIILADIKWIISVEQRILLVCNYLLNIFPCYLIILLILLFSDLDYIYITVLRQKQIAFKLVFIRIQLFSYITGPNLEI
jgi:hypothetical protein